jgi:hypothetical protein
MADAGALATLRAKAREAYTSQYTGEANHEALIKIYQQALSRARGLKKRTRAPIPCPGAPGEGQGGGSSAAGNKSNCPPHPSPLPEYREREKEAAQIAPCTSGEQVQA